MIDGSHLPFEENIRLTKQVVEYAHSKGVVVEGELGRLAGVEDDIKVKKKILPIPIPMKWKSLYQKPEWTHWQ